MKAEYNTAKRRALAGPGVDPARWLPVSTWARAEGLSPKRRAYTYALRLERLGLLARGRGRIVLRITPEGLRRLAWLEKKGR